MQETDISAAYNDDGQNGRLFTSSIRKYRDVHFYIVNFNLNVLILVIRNTVIFLK